MTASYCKSTSFALSLFLLTSPAVQASQDSSKLPTRRTPQQSSAGTLTVDDFLAESFRNSKSSYLDQNSGAFTINDRLIINPKSFVPSELGHLKVLRETGQWTTATGQQFDLRKAVLIFSDGRGGLDDMLAYFASDEFNQIVRDPFAVKYPRSPYAQGMSPGDFVEALIKSLGPEHSYLDGATGAIVASYLHLPLHNLDMTFCMEVLTIVSSGKIWVSPTGSQYDFRKTAFVFPATELGTPEQRKTARKNRSREIEKLDKILSEAQPASRLSIESILLTMNNPTQEPLPSLDRVKKVHLKPFSCQRLLTDKGSEEAQDPDLPRK